MIRRVQLHRDRLFLRRLSIEPQRRQSLAVPSLRLEDGDHLPREGLDLAGMAQLQVHDRQLQRHEGGVERNPALDERRPDLREGGKGLGPTPQAGRDLGLQPAQPKLV